MTATNEQSINIDSTRGSLLTDVQKSAESIPMPSTLRPMALSDSTLHEVKTILERPVNLGTYSWNSADQVLDFQLKLSDYEAGTHKYLQKYDFPQAIFEKSPIVVDKLKNYQYFKADIEIELKLNAQPFLAGALMMVYNPYHQQVLPFRRKGTWFMASQTSCPHKILTVEEGSSLKLTCPYANIYDYFDLSNPDNQFGTVYIYVFSPLVGPNADESAKFTVFARFVNPEFYVPTQNDTMSNVRDQHEISRLEQRGYRIAQADVAPVAPSDTGETQTPGPVSKIAGGVSTIADVLSGVPVIGGFASSVAWVARAIGKTAASLGWSKPTNIIPPSKFIAKPNHSLIHTEGQDDAVTLALIQDNGIDGTSFIPEYKDELSLKYIFQRPNYFHAQTASSALFSGNKLITKWEVSPFSKYQYGEVEDSTTLYLGSFAYASMFGTLWRGGINYDIRVVKTPYHQGRFAVVFLPETNLNQVPDTLGNLLNTNYNVVCDLKGTQEEPTRTTFRVTTPFISNVGWRRTYLSTNGVPNADTLDTKTGCLAIYALNDLSYPPTVSPQVTFYIAHSGADDYQISRPKLQLAPGYGIQYAQSDVGPFVVPEDENLLVPSHSSMDVSAQTTGEYFHSLRALMKRFGLLTNLTQSADYVGMLTRSHREDPNSGRRVMARQNFENSDYVLPTCWYMISFLYRFYNGSSSLKVFTPVPGAMASSYIDFDDDFAQVKVANDRDAIGKPVYQQLQQMSNVFELRTPYYRAIRGDVVSGFQEAQLGDVRTYVRMRNLAGYGGQSQLNQLYEAAGDDFNFYFLVGPPPMCDISKVDLPISQPSGTVRTINFANSIVVATGAEGGGFVLKVNGPEGPTFFNPELPNGPDFYPLTLPDLPITISYLNGTSETVSLNIASIANRDAVNPGVYFPITNTDVDLSKTITAFKNLGTVQIVDSYPNGRPVVSGTFRTLYGSSVTTLSQSGNLVAAINITTSPAVPSGLSDVRIQSSSIPSITVTYTDATTENIAVVSCSISTTGTPSLLIPVTNGKIVDEAPTILSIRDFSANIVTYFQ